MSCLVWKKGGQFENELRIDGEVLDAKVRDMRMRIRMKTTYRGRQAK
jgi:hypothetical protein